MATPRAFYYYEIQGDAYSDQATGEFVVDRFLKKPGCLAPTQKKAVSRKKKTLLLTDWTAQKLDVAKCGVIIETLSKLLQQGFQILVWQGNEFNPLTSEDINLLYLNEIRNSIIYATEDELIAKAISQLKTTKDKIQLLDNQWLTLLRDEKLLAAYERGDPTKHAWDISDVFSHTSYAYINENIDINNVKKLIQTHFDCDMGKVVFFQYEHIQVVQNINSIKLTASVISRLSNESQRDSADNQVTLEQVFQAASLEFFVTNLIEVAILIKGNENLRHLFINNCPIVFSDVDLDRND